METVLKPAGVLLLVALVAALGGYVWASGASSRGLSATYQAHAVDCPIPFPARRGNRPLTPSAA